MFARIQWRHPNAFVADVDEVAVFEIDAADILVGLPHERDHDTDVADWDLHHRHLFDMHEPRIQIPGARQENLLLQTAPPPVIDERLRILEVFMRRRSSMTGG